MTCPTGKSPFATQAQAKRALKRMHERNNNGVMPYHCAACGRWHLGSNVAGNHKRLDAIRARDARRVTE